MDQTPLTTRLDQADALWLKEKGFKPFGPLVRKHIFQVYDFIAPYIDRMVDAYASTTDDEQIEARLAEMERAA